MEADQLFPSGRQLLCTLAEFRFELRRFLLFSEKAAESVGLQPQQHQLLLQIAGAPAGATTTIAYAAGRLGLRHNSVVELVDRSEKQRLLKRVEDQADRRRVLLRLTRKGERLLLQLADEHASELHDMAPRLASVLHRIEATRSGSSSKEKAPSK
ncbi:MarR family transcriptional regulator [Acidisarcina polymorpha]|uniref:MarR family transcriptional regulator n=1 Tax=Acidisarcina polymorpha TaxID=2211140 RepID=UPI000DEFFE89|nr:MarR family transcriptional regulator [Acidisarcina polymorpha]